MLIKLFIKLLPAIEHHICTSYRVSKEFYGRVNEKQAEIGQGHMLLVNMCRVTSCIIFKCIEKEKLGIIIKSLIIERENK